MAGQEHQKEIFFHVGMGKAASTFLQYNVFPHFNGIEYIQRTRYHNYSKWINQSKASKILISREFDNQLHYEVDKFSAEFPNSKTIIILRKHDSWIASQYRRFVKNGWPLSFDEFIDIHSDKGLWKKESLDFYEKVKYLEEKFQHKPLVLFYDDLRKEPTQFIDKIAGYTGAAYNPADIDFNPIHRSYNEKQLKVMRRAGRWINITNLDRFNNKPLNFINKLGIYAIRYPLLAIGKYIPSAWVESGPLIPPQRLNEIAELYAEDWAKCVEYAAKNNH